MSYVNVQDRRLPFALRYLGDLMAYRHLCWNLVASDLRSRFRRTRLGVLWAVIQPLCFALLIAAVWGTMHKSSTYLEFAVYVFCGIVAFDFFSTAMSGGQFALSNAAGFVRQARIPLFVFQLRVVLSSVVMFVFSLIGILIFSTAVGLPPVLGPQLLLVPAFVGVAVMFALPITIIMSIMGTLYRDLQHISGLVERAIFMVSPIMLPREILSQPQLKFMEYVNPLVPFSDMFRDPMIYGRFWELQDVAVMTIWITGLWTLAIIMSVSVGRKLVFAI